MTDHESVQSNAVTSDERIRNVLRRHIQRAYDLREFTRDSLERESGVKVCHIDKIISRDPIKRRIAVEDAFCLAYTLGDDAVSALIGTIHYTAQRADDSEALQLGQVVATGLQAFSTIATAAADGRIDHTEAPACQEAADMLIATIMPLSSAGKGK